MSFAEILTASRRVFILRLLAEVGDANESVIHTATLSGGVGNPGRDDIRRDLDHLKSVGCVEEDWLNASLRVVGLTDRGRDAAHGRVKVDGVEHSRWNPKGA
jgi:hypothetical protein